MGPLNLPEDEKLDTRCEMRMIIIYYDTEYTLKVNALWETETLNSFLHMKGVHIGPTWQFGLKFRCHLTLRLDC